MDYYAGIDVSLEASSVCVVDGSPFALAGIGLEAGRCRKGWLRA